MKRETTFRGLSGDGVYGALRREILKLELAPGSELDEGVVSARFGVSRTPVREALIRLTAEGRGSRRSICRASATSSRASTYCSGR